MNTTDWKPVPMMPGQAYTFCTCGKTGEALKSCGCAPVTVPPGSVTVSYVPPKDPA